MKDSSHSTLHLTLQPTPCGIKLLHPRAASLRLFAKVCHRLSLILCSPPLWDFFPLLLPLPLTCSLVRSLPKGLVLLITSPQQRNRRKKEGQCETSVRFISVSSDPDTARDWHWLPVSPCLCVWANRWRTAIHGMSSCFAYTHTYVFGCLRACVCVFGGRVNDVWGDDPIILVLLLTAGRVLTTEINTTT